MLAQTVSSSLRCSKGLISVDWTRQLATLQTSQCNSHLNSRYTLATSLHYRIAVKGAWVGPYIEYMGADPVVVVSRCSYRIGATCQVSLAYLAIATQIDMDAHL